ncbi:hypothetical protein ElyMa_005737100 [Elysia marginata]|uniref:Uncharacterized protein n=1 Tax=Elysia marginata TaxID=1093978 RepID=A0AAV4FL99_9GAST|nr:hypothetical protein ElyMa_005737100 [Elysia marginata]
MTILPHPSKVAENIDIKSRESLQVGPAPSLKVDRYSTVRCAQHINLFPTLKSAVMLYYLQAESQNSVNDSLSTFLRIYSAFTSLRQRLGTNVYQDAMEKFSRGNLKIWSRSCLDSLVPGEKTSSSVRPFLSHVIGRSVTSQNIMFDDTNVGANLISPVQLLSLLLLPEVCV